VVFCDCAAFAPRRLSPRPLRFVLPPYHQRRLFRGAAFRAFYSTRLALHQALPRFFKCLEICIIVYIIQDMNFTWRESKRKTNLKKHGFDFAQSAQVFNGPTITVEDSRDYHGEQRFNTTGFLGATIVTISHTETEDQIHVISMRKAEPHEIDTLSHYL
jgi:uncharacterized DUF497 family protein